MEHFEGIVFDKNHVVEYGEKDKERGLEDNKAERGEPSLWKLLGQLESESKL